jgi:hypothetical protein
VSSWCLWSSFVSCVLSFCSADCNKVAHAVAAQGCRCPHGSHRKVVGVLKVPMLGRYASRRRGPSGQQSH